MVRVFAHGEMVDPLTTTGVTKAVEIRCHPVCGMEHIK